MNKTVLATGDNHKVLWSVVECVAVDVVDYFRWIKSAAARVSSHKTVFRHIAVLVGARVAWLPYEYVALSNAPATFPLTAGGAVRNLMARDVAKEVATSVATGGFIGCSDRSRTAAAAEAEAGWI